MNSSEDAGIMIEQSFNDQVLLHHIQRQIRRFGGRPHQRRSEDDGQIRDVHSIVRPVFSDFQQMFQQVLQRVVILHWQPLDDFYKHHIITISVSFKYVRHTIIRIIVNWVRNQWNETLNEMMFWWITSILAYPFGNGAYTGDLEGLFNERAGNQRLLQLTEEQFQTASKNVHVVFYLQHSPVVVIHLLLYNFMWLDEWL